MKSQRFNPHYFIFLNDNEMHHLVSANNRGDFQPELRTFLSATQNLKMLRCLAFESDPGSWTAPQLREEQRDGRIVIVDQGGKIRGCRETLPLPARPGEPQMCLSYDWFWSGFVRFLCQKDLKDQKKVWAYHDETNLYVMIPANTDFSLDQKWQSFWDKLASKEFFDQSVGIFLDHKTLFKKQASPWGSEHIPILSEQMAQELIHYYQYGRNRKKHFKQQSISRAISELEQLIKKGDYALIPLRHQHDATHATGGDFFSGKKLIRCAACGEILSAKEGYERLAVFLKNADERPQSGTYKDQKARYCKRCVATVFLCPVKLTPETLAIRFKSELAEKSGATLLVEQTLKKFVAQSLHVQSGSFINLHLTESIVVEGKRKQLVEVWGIYHYALWKIATLFAPELFVQGFKVEVYPGEETFSLPIWALWLVSSFARWDSVFQYNCYAHKDNRTSFSRFLRMISHEKIFEAFYTLISGNVIHASYVKTWRLNALQDIWSAFEQILNKEDKNMPIPDYPRIAGMTGLLLPFAERVQSAKKQPDEKRTAIKKLLQEVDRPVQYAYTATRETGSPDFIFCKRTGNRYFFEKALDLLKEAGEDIERLKQEAEKKTTELAQKDEKFVWMQQADEKIFLCPDQIMRVVSALVSEGIKEGEKPPYKSETDWRTFTYQVKLALWSMFPQHLGPQN